MGLFALKGEDRKGSLAHDRARCYKVSKEGTGCTVCTRQRDGLIHQSTQTGDGGSPEQKGLVHPNI